MAIISEIRNNPEVLEALQNYYLTVAQYEEAQAKIAPFLEAVDRARGLVKELVELYGGYKDGKNVAYWEERVSISYDVGQFKKAFPEFVAACIEEVVNATKVKGLLKGGLITEEALEPATIERPTQAFICPVPKG